MRYRRSDVKCPKSKRLSAVLTEFGAVHLFSDRKHWTMNVRDILPATGSSSSSSDSVFVADESCTCSRSVHKARLISDPIEERMYEMSTRIDRINAEVKSKVDDMHCLLQNLKMSMDVTQGLNQQIETLSHGLGALTLRLDHKEHSDRPTRSVESMRGVSIMEALVDTVSQSQAQNDKRFRKLEQGQRAENTNRIKISDQEKYLKARAIKMEM